MDVKHSTVIILLVVLTGSIYAQQQPPNLQHLANLFTQIQNNQYILSGGQIGKRPEYFPDTSDLSGSTSQSSGGSFEQSGGTSQSSGGTFEQSGGISQSSGGTFRPPSTGFQSPKVTSQLPGDTSQSFGGSFQSNGGIVHQNSGGHIDTSSALDINAPNISQDFEGGIFRQDSGFDNQNSDKLPPTNGTTNSSKESQTQDSGSTGQVILEFPKTEYGTQSGDRFFHVTTSNSQIPAVTQSSKLDNDSLNGPVVFPNSESHKNFEENIPGQGEILRQNSSRFQNFSRRKIITNQFHRQQTSIHEGTSVNQQSLASREVISSNENAILNQSDANSFDDKNRSLNSGQEFERQNSTNEADMIPGSTSEDSMIVSPEFSNSTPSQCEVYCRNSATGIFECCSR